jgi:hypothetical protein
MLVRRIEITLRDKNLDRAAEEYIVGAVRELGSQQTRLIVQLPHGTTDDEACAAVMAIREYFVGRARDTRHFAERRLFARIAHMQIETLHV